MASAKTSRGAIAVVGVVSLAVGIFGGNTLFKLNSTGTVDKSKTIYTSAELLSPCTNTGGKANYSACYFQNPFTGSGLIKRLDLITEANPSGTFFDCGVVPALTASGTQLRDSGNSGSGRTLTMSTGSVIVPPGWYVKCAATKTPGPAFEAVMYSELLEYHKL